MKTKTYFITLIFLSFLLAACSSGKAGDQAGIDDTSQVAAGDKLYNQAVIGSSAGCATCHSLQPGVIIVGPSLAEIATQAASALPDMGAEAYIRQSILEPDAHLAPGYPPGVMPKNWQEVLSGEQVESLVAFLLTKK